MARIRSKNQLIDLTKSQLGEPAITVEVTEDQISEIIDMAVQKFSEYAYGTLEETVILDLNGMKDYALPEDITNILKLSKGGTTNLTNFSANFGSGFVPDMWSEQYFSGFGGGEIIQSVMGISANRAMLDKYFGDDLSYNFNHNRKILQLHENYIGPVLLYYEYEYIANDADDLIFNHEWIKAYTKAKVKELWGTVTGKYDQTLVGGARINYDRFLSEGESEIVKLEEELLSKWSDPAPILIG